MSVINLASRRDTVSPVYEALQINRLDPERYIIHGGAVLALLGLRQATDVDVMIEPSYFKAILKDGQTPGGFPVVIKKTIPGRRAFLARSIDRNHLTIDAGTFKGVSAGMRFSHHFKLTHTIQTQSELLHIVSPLETLDTKQSIMKHSNRLTDKQDVTLLRQYLDHANYHVINDHLVEEISRRNA